MSESKVAETRGRNPKNSNLSDRAMTRLKGLSDALEAPNAGPMYFASPSLAKKPTRQDVNHMLLSKIFQMNQAIRQQKINRRKAEEEALYARRN